MKNNKLLPNLLSSFCVIILLSSCGGIKNLQYLQGSFDSSALSQLNVPEPRIQKGDLLSITIYSDDPAATAALTRPNAIPLTGSGQTSNQSYSPAENEGNGFLVDQQGQVYLYKLGRIPAEGKTKSQLADTLALLYAQKDLLKNPFVEVRFLNYKITVIGEVFKPGLYTIPSDKVTAIEAIGLAGDITQYGRRDNLLVIRESNGVRHFGKLDLSKPDVFLSPYFYLQQNDVVIVDVYKNKAAVNNQNTTQTITIVSSVLTTIAIFISVFRR